MIAVLGYIVGILVGSYEVGGAYEKVIYEIYREYGGAVGQWEVA